MSVGVQATNAEVTFKDLSKTFGPVVGQAVYGRSWSVAEYSTGRRPADVDSNSASGCQQSPPHSICGPTLSLAVELFEHWSGELHDKMRGEPTPP